MNQEEVSTELSFRERVALGRVFEREVKANRKKGAYKDDRRDSREIVGERVGLTGRSWEYARYVAECAEADPATYGEIAERMYAGNVAVNVAWRLAKIAGGEPDPGTRAGGSGHRGATFGYKGPPRTRVETAQRLERIKELATSGYRARDIAREVGMRERSIQTILQREGIKTVSTQVGRQQRIDVNKAMEGICQGALPSAQAVTAVKAGLAQLDQSRIEEWSRTLQNASWTYRKLSELIRKGQSNGN